MSLNICIIDDCTKTRQTYHRKAPCHMFILVCFLRSEVTSQQCLLVAVILSLMYSHTGLPCCRHDTPPRHRQYTDMGPTYHYAIHWCRISHRKPQLPISWPFTHEITLKPNAVVRTFSQKHSRKFAVPSQYCTWDLCHVNPLYDLLRYSCFLIILLQSTYA